MSDLPKSEWGEGPWQHEPDKMEWRDKETGLPCLIVRGPVGALCGYVGVPQTHPAYGLSYDGIPDDQFRAIQKQFMKRLPYFNKLMAGGADFAQATVKMSEGVLERPEPSEVGNKIANVEVHGGLTYSATCNGHICHTPEPGEPDNVWWFGFDCAHAGDKCPSIYATASKSYRRTFRDEEYRDVAYVQAECAGLAKQLAAI